MKLVLLALALLLCASLLDGCAIPASVYYGGAGYSAGYAQRGHSCRDVR